MISFCDGDFYEIVHEKKRHLFGLNVGINYSSQK